MSFLSLNEGGVIFLEKYSFYGTMITADGKSLCDLTTEGSISWEDNDKHYLQAHMERKQ
jgi:hypothetical protein